MRIAMGVTRPNKMNFFWNPERFNAEGIELQKVPRVRRNRSKIELLTPATSTGSSDNLFSTLLTVNFAANQNFKPSIAYGCPN